MNPANFPNVGAAATMAGAPNPNQMNGTANVQRHMMQYLQSQGPFTGWRAEVPLEDRFKKTWQLFVLLYQNNQNQWDPNADHLSGQRVSSLRLAQSKPSVPAILREAQRLEEQAFREAHQKVSLPHPSFFLVLAITLVLMQILTASLAEPNRRITIKNARKSYRPFRKPADKRL